MGTLSLIPQDGQTSLAAATCSQLSDPLIEQPQVILPPNPQDGQTSLAIAPFSPSISQRREEKSTKPPRDLVCIESEYCPEAIVEYFNLGASRARDNKNEDNLKDLRMKVKKHLSYVGWKFFYINKGTRLELRYKSPTEKVYISLITACKGCLDGEGKFYLDEYASRGTQNINTSEEAEGRCSQKRPTPHHDSDLPQTRSTDDLNGDFSTPVNKRARGAVAPPPSRQNTRNILLRLIDNNEVSAGAEVHYRGRDGRAMAEGQVTRDGIKCNCCQVVFNLSNFEAHAGSTNHRPAANIFLKDGRSLQDCQLLLKHDINKPRKVMGNRNHGSNGYICSVCHDGGALVLCYQCPSSFHTSCLGLEEVPNGDWFCQSCEDQPTNEAEYSPQAIVDYFLGSEILKRTDDNNNKLRDLRSKAKKHLCSVGWSFFYTSEGTKRELRYKSPSGIVYASLIAACEGCIFEDGWITASSMTTLSD